MIRAFVAVPLPEPLRQALAVLAGKLRDAGVGGRATRASALHLTLRFLGQIEEETAAEIGRSLEGLGAEVGPFEVRLSDLGAFPNSRHPRVVWMGFAESPALGELKRHLDRRLSPFGFEPETRVFRPHVTLLRLKRPVDVTSFLNLAPRDRALDNPFLVDKAHLYRSLLKPTGAEYLKLATGRLTMEEDHS